MLKKACLAFLLNTALLLNAGKAQGTGPQLVNIAKPSPNVQAMQKYGDIPVSAYTGIPNISIPLFNLQFRDINLPISISYHASGIKVAEEASQVGLGWSLNAGGSISRSVVGADDFLYGVYFNSATHTHVDYADGRGLRGMFTKNGIMPLYSNITGDQRISDDVIWPELTTSPATDFQPDQYYYNLPSGSGKFIVKRDQVAVLQKPEKIQISMISPDGTVWQIVSTDGTVYDFNNVFETYTDNTGTNISHMSAWYLTKITSPNGNIVTFNYNVFTSQTTTLGSYSELYDNTDILSDIGTFPNHRADQKGQVPGKIYVQVKLASIDCATEQIKFFYSDGRTDLQGDKKLDSVCLFTKDVAGVVASTPLKSQVLTYGYFSYSNTDDDMNLGASTYSYQRLKLNQVQEIGYYHGVKTVNSPYSFTYFEGSSVQNLPSKGSFARDHWGYYNGRTSNMSLVPTIIPVSSSDFVTSLLGLDGPQRTLDTAYLKAFTLRSIQYPTGGSTEFDFEANDFDEQLSEVNDHSFFNQAFSVSQKQVQKDFDVNRSIDTLHLEDLYRLDPKLATGAPNIQLNATFRFGSINDCGKFFSPGMIYFDIYDSTGTTSLISKDIANIDNCTGGATSGCKMCNAGVYTYLTDIRLYPGKYVIKVHATFDTALVFMRLIFTYNTMQTSVPPPGNINTIMFSYAGGLRVRQIIDHDGISSSNDHITHYIYHYWADKDNNGTPEEYSFGRRMSKPVYTYFEASLEVGHVHDGALSYTNFGWGAYMMRASDSNNPLNGSAQGSVVGYDQVTVLHGANGENGITTYKYYNQPDLVYSFIDTLMLPEKPPYASNIADLSNGSLVEEREYALVNTSTGNLKSFTNTSNDYIKVKEIKNQYKSIDYICNPVFGIESRKPTSNYWESTSNGMSYGGSYNMMPPDFIYCYGYRSLNQAFSYLASSDEKVFNQGDTTQYNEVLQTYYYDNIAHLLPTRVVTNNSRGELITTTTTYPLDYSTNTSTDAFNQGIKNLQAKNVISAPVERATYKSAVNGSNNRLVNSVLTTYNNALPAPSTIYSTELTVPSTSFVPASINATGLVKDNSYSPLISFDTYDANGNLVQQHKVNDNNHSYIWDYQSAIPVADVNNAPQTKIAYTSFEFDGAGNWSIPSTLRDNTKGVTGSRSYNLTNGAITKNTGIVAGDTIIVSYWSTGSSSYTVSGNIGTAVKGKTATINGTNWTYFEHMVTGVTSVTVSGTGPIDELRLYPKYAQMTSYSFDLGVGMTSQCDVNNRVSYYEYDGLCRLKDIKDQDGNILKTFEYHYKQ